MGAINRQMRNLNCLSAASCSLSDMLFTHFRTPPVCLCDFPTFNVTVCIIKQGAALLPVAPLSLYFLDYTTTYTAESRQGATCRIALSSHYSIVVWSEPLAGTIELSLCTSRLLSLHVPPCEPPALFRGY